MRERGGGEKVITKEMKIKTSLSPEKGKERKTGARHNYDVKGSELVLSTEADRAKKPLFNAGGHKSRLRTKNRYFANRH